MGTSAHTKEEVAMEVAFWWQLTVGLQLSQWDEERQVSQCRQAASFPGGLSSHLVLLIARLSALYDLGALCWVEVQARHLN